MSNAHGAAPLGSSDRHVHGGRRTPLIVLGILVALALVLGVGAFAYAKQYDGKALPGTTVLGQDVAGKTPEQIAALVQERADAVKVSVTAGGEAREAGLADLGVSVDADATAVAATREVGMGEVLSSTFSGERAIDPVVTVDADKAAAYAHSLVPADSAAPRDAAVVWDEDAKAWTVQPGQSGQGVDPSLLVAAVEQNAPALADFAIDQPFQEIPPAISDDAAQSAVDAVTARLDQPVSIAGAGGKTHEASRETRSDWYVVAPNADGTGFDVTVDQEKVTAWVSGRAEKEAVKPTDGVEQVDAAGATTKVITEKKDGLEVANSEAVVEQLVTSMNAGEPAAAAFETKPVAAEVHKAKAPEAAAAAPAPGAPAAEPTGEKWIDVDLTSKTVTAYRGDTPVWGPVKIVDGKKGYETVTGTFEIYLTYENQDMTNASRYGEDDPRYYYTEDVPWVQYFKGGYAFHGAPWRSSFGHSGSHGCVNMRVSDAKWLYDWAGKGTKVVSHY
ncbi:L,D-transpeptidase family protein [Brachybacterium huguangmaarense]